MVYLWASDDEKTARVDVYCGLAVQILCWDDRLDDLLQYFRSQFGQADLFAVLK